MTHTIGKMRETVVFLQNTPTAKGAGFEDNYTTLLTTRGSLEDNGGDRSLSFGDVKDNSRMILTVRYQAALAAGLRSDTKVVINGDTYTITEINLIRQLKHFYRIKIQCQTR